MKEVFYSDDTNAKPDYASYPPKEKFQAITGIIMERLFEHPKAFCAYSGGSDSDILIDLLESARKLNPSLPEIKYAFFNTGLEMKAIKDHVKEISEKYGVEIEEIRSNPNIIQATRKYGLPFYSKTASRKLHDLQTHPEVPISIYYEYVNSEDKSSKIDELIEKYPNCAALIHYITGTKADNSPCTNAQLSISSIKYFVDFINEFPPDFKISERCCEVCKKRPAHKAQKGYEMVITGEREAEGGQRTVAKINGSRCFYADSEGQFRLRPLYYVSDSDKAWYKETHGLRYSDAYETYGLKRTGCCGCSITAKATKDLEIIGKYEPNVAKAAWNIFGKSYEYRRKYNEYKKKRMEEEKAEKARKKAVDKE